MSYAPALRPARLGDVTQVASGLGTLVLLVGIGVGVALWQLDLLPKFKKNRRSAR